MEAKRFEDVIAICKERYAVTHEPQLRILKSELNQLDRVMKYDHYPIIPDEIAHQLAVYIMAQYLMKRVVEAERE